MKHTGVGEDGLEYPLDPNYDYSNRAAVAGAISVVEPSPERGAQEMFYNTPCVNLLGFRRFATELLRLCQFHEVPRD